MPFMQPFFKQEYGMSKSIFGIMFAAVIFVAFGGASTLVVILEAKIGTKASICIGAYSACLGYLLLGPAPPFWFLQNTGSWEGILALTLMFTGNTFPMILTAGWGLTMAQRYGMSEEEASVKTASYAIVIMAIGQTLGPVPGSALAGHFGVGWATMTIGSCTLAFILLLVGVDGKLEKVESEKSKALL